MTNSMHADIKPFGMDLKKTLTPWHHVAISSGWGVVQPLMPTVCGVGAVFCPPVLARDFVLKLGLEVDGHRLVDDGNYGKGDCGLLYAGGTWHPDRLERKGTYHHLIKGRLISLEVRSELVPLFGRAGFLLEVGIRNRAGGRCKVKVVPEVAPGRPDHVPLSRWDYGIPSSTAAEARQSGRFRWAGDQVSLELLHEGLSIASLGSTEQTIFLACVFGGPAKRPASLRHWRDETRQAWAKRIRMASKRMPMLTSDIPGLEDYYARSLVSGLVCLWERPDFVSNPFMATSGMDGGAICCYPWDTGGYAPHTLALMLGDRIKRLVEVQTTGRMMEDHSRFAPDGTPHDVPYAYNMASLVGLFHAVSCHHGVDPRMFATVRDSALAIDGHLNRRGELVDWGVQHNLLEMRQTGWEHFVASPNAERAWCFDRLADMADRIGGKGGTVWRARARAIRKAIHRELWDAKAGWFRCLFPDGHEERVYSIQVFDAMQTGACTKAMVSRIISHVRDGQFLGEYGVSSISAEDREHYELNDPDWSGGGAYSGDGPALAQTLWEAGHPERAWDVLQRFFWMGRHLLYFPQEHYCDKPSVVPHKRANVVAGLAGAEAVLRGMFGLTFGVDGSVSCRPSPKSDGQARLSGLMVHGRHLDVEMDGRKVAAWVDGKCVYSGGARTIPLIASCGGRSRVV